jgi:hypothetical protein
LRTVVIGSSGNGAGIDASPPQPLPSFESPRSCEATTDRHEPRPRKKVRRQKDFIVRYDGKYICHFRARSPLLPKAAFTRIKEELAKTIPDFRPDLLVLFQPVRLRTGGASAGAEGPEGELIWFKAPEES